MIYSRYDGSSYDNCLLSDSRIDNFNFGRLSNLETKYDWTVYRINPSCRDGGGSGKCSDIDFILHPSHTREYNIENIEDAAF